MCKYCEHYTPLLENENSRVFMVGNRLVLQDKTKPIMPPSDIGKVCCNANDHYENEGDGIANNSTVCYASTWVIMCIDRCPVCQAPLKHKASYTVKNYV